MENELKQKINDLENKIDAIYVSVEKTRKYFKIIFYVSIIFFILPLLAIAVILPKIVNTYLDLSSSF